MAFKAKSYLFNVVFRKLIVPRLDDDGEPQKTRAGETRMMPAKFEFPVQVPVGTTEDFESHWTREGLNPKSTLTGILNQVEKQSKEGFKGEVRSTVLAVENEIWTPKTTLAQLTKAVSDDPRVQKALEDMQANVTANHIGQPRNKDVTKGQAAKVGVALLNADPDMLKEIAKGLGIEL